jgi:hypothetical protein
LFSPLVIHHLLAPDDLDYLGRDGLAQLLRAVNGTHKGSKGEQSTSLGRTLATLDQENVDEAAPDWLLKRPDSKVNHFVRALRALIESGELQVNSFCAPIYVMGHRAAVVCRRQSLWLVTFSSARTSSFLQTCASTICLFNQNSWSR